MDHPKIPKNLSKIITVGSLAINSYFITRLWAYQHINSYFITTLCLHPSSSVQNLIKSLCYMVAQWINQELACRYTRMLTKNPLRKWCITLTRIQIASFSTGNHGFTSANHCIHRQITLSFRVTNNDTKAK